MSLTAEQLRRIDENRRRAQRKLAEKKIMQSHKQDIDNKLIDGNRNLNNNIGVKTGYPNNDQKVAGSVSHSSNLFNRPANNHAFVPKQTSPNYTSLNTHSNCEKPNSRGMQQCYGQTNSNYMLLNTNTDHQNGLRTNSSNNFDGQNAKQHVSHTSPNYRPFLGSNIISNNGDAASKSHDHISDDVKQRIEQNRLKALERLKKSKLSPPKFHNNATHKGDNSAMFNKPQILHSSVSPSFSKFAFNNKTTQQKSPNGLVNDSFVSANVWKSPDKVSAKQSDWLNSGKNTKPLNNSTITSFYGQTNVSNSRIQSVDSNSYPTKNSSTANTNANASKKLTFGLCLRGSCHLISTSRFEVQVNYHVALVEIFKTIKSKSYDIHTKKWSFSLEDHNNLLKAARVLQPDVLLDPLPKAILTSFPKQLKGDYSVTPIPDANLSGIDRVLVDALMPFQLEGVNFGISKGGRLLLADDMGLGKTIQAICLAAYYKHDWPLLVVTPSSVRFDWAQQIRRWLPSVRHDDISVATKSSDDCTNSSVNIVSYDIMTRRAEDLKNRGFNVVIMDECHMLKNIKTARTKAALPILQKSRRVFLLSGTPALSRPLELYTQIQAIQSRLMSYQEFGQRYCDGKQQQWGWDFSGSSNLTELQLLLENTLMIRRTKKEVLKQLPAKRRQVIQLDPASIKSTKSLHSSSKLMQCKQLKGMQRRGVLLEYYHDTGHAKLTAALDYIKDVVEGGQKLLVFAHHKEVLDALEDLVQSIIGNNYMRIDGRTTSEQRKVSCDRFQSDAEMKVAVLSIMAANSGLNLSAASTVVFVELFWNPGILVQAEDRVHRIGQEDSVNIHYLLLDCLFC